MYVLCSTNYLLECSPIRGEQKHCALQHLQNDRIHIYISVNKDIHGSGRLQVSIISVLFW